jgi:TetR/AcrR family transcriptional regulator
MKSAERAVGRASRINGDQARPRAWNNVVVDRAEGARLKRRALVAEAARAFGHRGFHNVSLDEVAIALNVSKPTLYNYVKSKYELLYECYNLALDLGEDALRQAQAEEGSGLEKLCSFIRHHIELLTRELGSAAVLFEFYSMRPEDRDKIQRRRRKFDRIFREMVAAGIADGSIAPCNPKLAVFWFMSAVSSIPRWFDPNGELTGRDIAAAFVGFLRSGLESRGKPTRRRAVAKQA